MLRAERFICQLGVAAATKSMSRPLFNAIFRDGKLRHGGKEARGVTCCARAQRPPRPNKGGVSHQTVAHKRRLRGKGPREGGSCDNKRPFSQQKSSLGVGKMRLKHYRTGRTYLVCLRRGERDADSGGERRRHSDCAPFRQHLIHRNVFQMDSGKNSPRRRLEVCVSDALGGDRVLDQRIGSRRKRECRGRD